MLTRTSTALGFAALIAVLAARPYAAADDEKKSRRIEVDVAENGTRFTPDSEPVFADGLPAYGAEFITEGYIYPAGTVSCKNNDCDGVNSDGSPQFPHKVIGKWYCRGWHVGDGAHTETGPWVVTTQTFDFGKKPGARTIVTDGFEYADFNVEFSRAIIGGTGRYREAEGQQTQEFLGWNPSVGTVLKMKLDVR